MSAARMTMMARADIRTELGWSDDMIHSLFQVLDSPNARRDKFTSGYTYGLYRRERVLAVAESAEGQAAKWEGMRRCVATRPIRGGRHAWGI
jgi:hypothetical protein